MIPHHIALENRPTWVKGDVKMGRWTHDLENHLFYQVPYHRSRQLPLKNKQKTVERPVAVSARGQTAPHEVVALSFRMCAELWSICFLAGSVVKNPAAKAGDTDCLGKIPWRRKWQPIPAFLPGESHGQRSLVGYSPWGRKRVIHDLVTKEPQNGQYMVLCLPRTRIHRYKNQDVKAEVGSLIITVSDSLVEFIFPVPETVDSLRSEVLDAGVEKGTGFHPFGSCD